MSQFNISEWALKHQAMVVFLIIVSLIGGIAAYNSLGRAEDPDYTFKMIVVRTLWPGATAEEMATQVTERIEKKLMETQWTKFTKSYSRPGESVVMFELRGQAHKDDILENHKQSRKKMEEVRPLLPDGVIGPFVNDEFGAVQIKIWALTGDGYDVAELYRRANHIARQLRLVKDVSKIELIGVQDE